MRASLALAVSSCLIACSSPDASQSHRGAIGSGSGGSAAAPSAPVGTPSTPSPSSGAPSSSSGAPNNSAPAHPFFVAVGYGGRRVTSSDSGKTWANDVEDAANGNDDPNLLRGVHCAVGMCVACGGGAEGGRFLVTRDGKTWKAYPTGTPGIGDVTYGDGQWVAPNFRSRDGVTWEHHEMPDGTNIRKIAYGGGAFVAVGDVGRRIATKDGVTWTNEATGGKDLSDIAYGAGKFVVVGYGGRHMTSPDGLTWTNDVSDATLGDLTGLAFANGMFIATSGVALVSSPDGITWTRHGGGDIPGGPIAFGGGVFIGLSWKNVRLTSKDGLAWSVARDDGEAANAFAAIAYGDLSAQ